MSVYRARLGNFSMPAKCKHKLHNLHASKSVVSKVLRLAIFLAVLVTLGSDVETNSGPHPATKDNGHYRLLRTLIELLLPNYN